MICVKCTAFWDLRPASRLANPFGDPSQFRTQVLSLQTCVACVDLRGRLARALEYTPRLFEIPDVLLRLVSKNALQIIILVSSLSEKSLKNMEFRCVSPVKRLFDTPRTKNPNSEPPCNNFNYTVQPRCIQSVLPEM